MDDGFVGESGLKGEDAVGDGGSFGGGADVVDADDVGSGEDGGYIGCGGGMEAGLRGGRGYMNDAGAGGSREGMAEEAFAGDADEDGQVELAELVEVGEQGIVLVEVLAEAEAGVYGDLLAGDACCCGGRDALLEACEDKRGHFI